MSSPILENIDLVAKALHAKVHISIIALSLHNLGFNERQVNSIILWAKMKLNHGYGK